MKQRSDSDNEITVSPLKTTKPTVARKFGSSSIDKDDEGKVDSENKSKENSPNRRVVVKRRRDPDEPKRPPTGYLLFYVEQRPIVVRGNPKLTFNAINELISKFWEAADQKPYHERAQVLKKKYLSDREEYLKGKAIKVVAEAAACVSDLPAGVAQEEAHKEDKEVKKSRLSEESRPPASPELILTQPITQEVLPPVLTVKNPAPTTQLSNPEELKKKKKKKKDAPPAQSLPEKPSETALISENPIESVKEDPKIAVAVQVPQQVTAVLGVDKKKKKKKRPEGHSNHDETTSQVSSVCPPTAAPHDQ